MPRVELSESRVLTSSATDPGGSEAAATRMPAAGRYGKRSAKGHQRGWWGILASLPAVGAAALPIGICPACWPIYAGVLGSLGLGFLLESVYLLPLMILFLGLALFALAFRARTRRGYGPLALGAASVALVLVFKFAYPVTPWVYAGLAGLMTASVWNAWPKKKVNTAPCPACASRDSAITSPHSLMKEKKT